MLSREEGKTRIEGIGEAMRTGQIFKFFAGERVRLAGEVLPPVRLNIGVEITREPIGVIDSITPRNLPIAIPPGRSPRHWRSATAQSSRPPTRCRESAFNVV